jgi:hypothetical protein
VEAARIAGEGVAKTGEGVAGSAGTGVAGTPVEGVAGTPVVAL